MHAFGQAVALGYRASISTRADIRTGPHAIIQRAGKSNRVLDLNVSTRTRRSASSRKCNLILLMMCDSILRWSLCRATCCDDTCREALDMHPGLSATATSAPSRRRAANAMTHQSKHKQWRTSMCHHQHKSACYHPANR
eukprot:UN4630